MSITQHNDRDQLVAAELEKLSTTTTTGEYFARALELGATPAYLARIARSYRQNGGSDGFDIVGLPYVADLLSAGWSNAQVREFLQEQCFNEKASNVCNQHREGFWNDLSTWEVFDDADTFVAFMQQYAATYEGCKRVLTEDGHNLLESSLVMWRHTPQEWQRDVRKIEMVAASHLTFIEDEYQLRQMIRYAVVGRDTRETNRELARRATNVGWWGWNLVFRGYVLAKLAPSSREHDLVERELSDILRRKPEQPAYYRWLAEGFWRACNEYWDMRIEQVQSTFRQHGWHFGRATGTPDGTPQLVLNDRGRRITVRHMPGGEPVRAGDDVMVHEQQLGGLAPKHTPGGKLYALALTPARPPTPEQLADVRGQFHSKK